MNIETINNFLVIYHDSDFRGKTHKDNVLISLYGKIYCGMPNFIDDYREAFLEIPQSMIQN